MASRVSLLKYKPKSCHISAKLSILVTSHYTENKIPSIYHGQHDLHLAAGSISNLISNPSPWPHLSSWCS